ncbi:Crp/Fnr family transcriptional regulator [Pseudomonas indica]|uniref:Crp/Fnr family transcriptional regulator n=1 Tax=Pseudomonas indica TaxID=137658 RepID=UPI0023FA2893|nr:Crp/Fnr family transcriptional regulator [Pseudomonas indica]MBU3056653.1 Crp/Fnr family transcriptional regulator [Pseudomonas indica]
MHSNESAEDSLLRRETLSGQSHLLHGLPAELIRHVALHSTERTLRDKDVLFLKHDPDDFIALVIAGQIYTVLYGPDGRELIINDIGSGEVVGETALIQPSRRETSAYASGPTQVLILGRRHFAPLIANPTFLERALALLCSRLREASSFVEMVCLHRLESRLARYLLASLAQDASASDAASAALPANQSILAAMLNASRPKLNAQLQSWKRQGLISCRSDRILINDIGQLRRMAELPSGAVSPR